MDWNSNLILLPESCLDQITHPSYLQDLGYGSQMKKIKSKDLSQDIITSDSMYISLISKLDIRMVSSFFLTGFGFCEYREIFKLLLSQDQLLSKNTWLMKCFWLICTAILLAFFYWLLVVW